MLAVGSVALATSSAGTDIVRDGKTYNRGLRGTFNEHGDYVPGNGPPRTWICYYAVCRVVDECGAAKIAMDDHMAAIKGHKAAIDFFSALTAGPVLGVDRVSMMINAVQTAQLLLETAGENKERRREHMRELGSMAEVTNMLVRAGEKEARSIAANAPLTALSYTPDVAAKVAPKLISKSLGPAVSLYLFTTYEVFKLELPILEKETPGYKKNLADACGPQK